ncbi:DUF6126 family protein [Streptomyces lavendulae]|uniref:Uncharacterized protein n=1 Tax=Streptomyces lavendulae subsp. lavendulae TaxID=58340 RepID=A0A2K8P9H7_STRLA|nr:DUF6126 family protein [Streptomyces lavendulae]ATZ22760.1 hypothetical protein SLAV_04260 [Streptomyces lavendulae subsp. lavendulae]QUQ52602.1 hypothetical protein SLLC_02295 [Streptomyces lavendulae subsp. lavendulae]
MTKGENMPTTSEKTEATSEAAGTPFEAAGATSQETGTTAGTPAGTDAAAQPAGLLGRIESRFPRGLVIRLIAYLFVGHLFAFFVYLLFVLGGQNQ